MTMPGQCFISYSHRDHRGFEQLLVHLTAVANLYRFKLWHDRRIKPGYYWNATIKAEIEKSDIFIPLITNAFFASDYINQHELPAMLKRHQNVNALLVPVVYRESCWRNYFGNYIELVPKNSKHNLVPVFKWPDREEALAARAPQPMSDAVLKRKHQAPNKRAALIMEKVLEPRREWWTQAAAWAACILYRAGNDDERWQEFYALASAMSFHAALSASAARMLKRTVPEAGPFGIFAS
jgi:hypothetical protein